MVLLQEAVSPTRNRNEIAALPADRSHSHSCACCATLTCPLNPFYDIGDATLKGQSFGPVAHAAGAGLGLDVVWLGLIERTMLRVDFAKALNTNTPMQIWFRIEHPF